MLRGMIGEVAGSSKCLSPHLSTLLYCYFASWLFVLTKTRLYARLGSSETKDSVELEDERKTDKIL